MKHEEKVDETENNFELSAPDSDAEEEEEEWQEPKPALKRKRGRPRKPKIETEPDREIKRRFRPSKLQDFLQPIRLPDGRQQCPQCPKVLGNRRGIMRHLENDHLAGRYECQHCENAFYYPYSHFSHHKERHKGEPYRCLRCEVAIELDMPLDEYKEHYHKCHSLLLYRERKDARGKGPRRAKLQCEQCGRSFQHISDLSYKEHMAMHAGEPPMQCDRCPFTTHYSYSLKTHINSHLREEGKETDDSGKSLFYECSECGKRFASNSSRMHHFDTVHLNRAESRECDICHKKVMGSRLHMAKHKFRVHKVGGKKCPVCGKMYEAWGFKRHVEVHKGPKFFCKYCGKGLMTQKSCIEHEYQHTGENPVSCEQCDYKCKSMAVLNKHQIFRHGRQKGTTFGPKPRYPIEETSEESSPQVVSPP